MANLLTCSYPYMNDPSNVVDTCTITISTGMPVNSNQANNLQTLGTIGMVLHVLGLILILFRFFELWVFVASNYDPSKMEEKSNRSRTGSFGGSANLTCGNNYRLMMANDRGAPTVYLLVYFILSLVYFADVNGYQGRVPLPVVNTVDGLRISILICIFLIIMERWIEMLNVYKATKYKYIGKMLTTFLLRIIPLGLFVLTISLAGLAEWLDRPDGALYGVLNGYFFSFRFFFYSFTLLTIVVAFSVVVHTTIQLLGGYRTICAAFAEQREESRKYKEYRNSLRKASPVVHNALGPSPALAVHGSSSTTKPIRKPEFRKRTSSTVNRYKMIRKVILGMVIVAASLLPSSYYFAFKAVTFGIQHYFVFVGSNDEVNQAVFESLIQVCFVLVYVWLNPGWKPLPYVEYDVEEDDAPPPPKKEKEEKKEDKDPKGSGGRNNNNNTRRVAVQPLEVEDVEVKNADSKKKRHQAMSA